MRVLFINDDTILNPIIQSQGLPHLGFLADYGNDIFVLSFESVYSESMALKIQDIVHRYPNITFIVTGPFIRNFLSRKQLLILRPIVTLYYAHKYAIECIHARSYMPAFVGLFVKVFLNVRLIFDMRGLLIDELISTGRWKRGSFKVRVMRLLEKQAIIRSDSVVVVSKKFAQHVVSLKYLAPSDCGKIDVIYNAPSVHQNDVREVDGDIEYIQRQNQGKKIIVYSGSLAPWQGIDEVVYFYRRLHREYSNVILMILTYESVDAVQRIAEKHQLSGAEYFSRCLPFDTVSAYLSISDFALLIRKDELLNNVSCPLKFGEYLMAGTPVGITKGIGDTVEIVNETDVGTVIDISTEHDVQDSIRRSVQILRQDRETMRLRCQKVANEKFSFEIAVKQYQQVYRRLSEAEIKR